MRRWFSIACAALLALVMLGAASAADETAPLSLQELDQRLGQTFRDLHIPGASVAIIEDKSDRSDERLRLRRCRSQEARDARHDFSRRLDQQKHRRHRRD